MAKWHDSPEWRKARAYAKTVLEPICTYCNKDLHGDDYTIDHVIASDPPNHDIANLVAACRSCNGRKQDRTLTRTTWQSPRWHNK